MQVAPRSRVVLALPLAVFWKELPVSWAWRLDFVLILGFLWINPALVFNLCLPGEGWPWPRITPFWTLTIVSFQCYALLGLFLLGIRREAVKR